MGGTTTSTSRTPRFLRRFFAWLRRLRQRYPREHWREFAGFLWHRFVADRCFESAGALSYTTIFALVPLTAGALGVAAAFPAFQSWTDRLTDFVFANFVPQAARVVESYLRQFADSARGLTSIGAVALLVSALLTMASVEDTFNRIWRVTTPRRRLARFLVYWVALTLGPLLILASLALSSYLFSLPFISGAAQQFGLEEWLLQKVPLLVEMGTFTLAYMIVPNRVVRIRFALVGGLLATLLFEAAKSGLATYLSYVPSYTQVYGALAAIPIFLIWIYLSWTSVLLGASFAASLGTFRWQPAAQRLPAGQELYALLRLLARFAVAQRSGRGLHGTVLQELEPMFTDDLLQHFLGELEAAQVLQANELGEWLLVRDLNHLDLSELYQRLRLRVPVARLPLPGQEDPIGRAAIAAIERLREPLEQGLKQRVAGIFSELPVE